MNRFLVIGSNSFTGSNFIQALKKNNHFFIGCSRSKKLNYPYLPKSFVKQYRFEKLDLNNDVEAMFNLIKKYNISHIVNFASQSMVAQSWENPIDWYNTNLISIIKLCQKLLKYKKLKKFTQVTTPEVYGSTSKFVKENFNFNPSTPYASSRAACDIYLKNLYDNYNFPIVFTRASNVYGPGQQLYRLIPKAIISFLNKKKFPLQGDGGSKRNFIYIDDVVNATLKVSLKGKIGQTYHISNKDIVSTKQVLRIIANKLNLNLQDYLKFVPERKGKDQMYLLDANKIKKEFNWESKFSLEKGIEKNINWVNQNLKFLNKEKLIYIHKK